MTTSIYGTSIGGGKSTTIASETARFGTLPVVRQFFSGMPGSTPTGLTSGMVWIPSFKCSATDYTGLAAGTYDAALVTWLRGLPSGQNVLACYYHEPEDNGFTLTQWKAAAGHWNNLVHTTTGITANVKATQIYMIGTILGWNSRNINNYWDNTWDANHKPDHLGFDFDGPIVNVNAATYPDMSSWVTQCQTFATGKGVPWSVCEFGGDPLKTDTTHSGRATWNTTSANQFSAGGAVYVTYWDDGTPYLSQSNEITAWANLVATTPTATPSAPTGLNVTPASNGTTATVTWTGPTSGVDHWDAYIQGPGQTYPHKLNTAGPIPVTPRSYTFPTTPGTTYNPGAFLVSVGDSAGTLRSGYSAGFTFAAPNPGAGGSYPVITSAVPTQDTVNPLLYTLTGTATGTGLTYLWTFTYPADPSVSPITLASASGSVTFTKIGNWTGTFAVTNSSSLTTTQNLSLPITGSTSAAVYTPNFNLQMLQHTEDVRDMAIVEQQSKPIIDNTLNALFNRQSPQNAKYQLAASNFAADNISGSVTQAVSSGSIFWWTFTLEDLTMTQLLFATSVAQSGTGAVVGVHDITGALLSDFNGTPASGTAVDGGFQTAAKYGIVVPLGLTLKKNLTWGQTLVGQAYFPAGMGTYPTFRCSGVGGGAAIIGTGTAMPLWGFLTGQSSYATNVSTLWPSWTAQNQIWVGGQ